MFLEVLHPGCGWPRGSSHHRGIPSGPFGRDVSDACHNQTALPKGPTRARHLITDIAQQCQAAENGYVVVAQRSQWIDNLRSDARTRRRDHAAGRRAGLL